MALWYLFEMAAFQKKEQPLTVNSMILIRELYPVHFYLWKDFKQAAESNPLYLEEI